MSRISENPILLGHVSAVISAVLFESVSAIVKSYKIPLPISQRPARKNNSIEVKKLFELLLILIQKGKFLCYG
ncbi:MAG: hypothetical protein KGZ34_04740 [Nitrosarchaeum sp.]|nr:hypothetical protein [Nitrosarchaeum sp.]